MPPPKPEPAGPHPVRFWWLKRLTMASLLLAFLLAGVWVAWSREADRRLRRELAPLVAAGEPVNAPTMNPPPVPDSENGALLYRKAWKVVKEPEGSPSNSSISYAGYPPFPPRWHRLADRSIPINAPTLALARQARGYRRFDWGVRGTSPSYGILLRHLNDVRALANFVTDAALYAHLHGDDAEAIERVRDVRHESKALAVQPLFIVTHMVAMGCERLALNRILVIAPALTIEPGPGSAAVPATPSSARPASRAQVRALITELLDDAGDAERLRQVHVGERAAELDMGELFGRAAPAMRPMFDLDAVRVIRLNEVVIRAAARPNWPEAKAAIRSDPLAGQVGAPQTDILGGLTGRLPAAGSHRKAVDYTRLLCTDVTGVTGIFNARVIEQDMRLRAERGLAAASLAVRLYRADHAGQFPPGLGALVPDYLPRLPRDPLAAHGRPIGYHVARGALPGGADRPLVYSVGPDGVDDTATTGLAWLPSRPCYDSDQKMIDEWRDLTRWSPPQSATELEEDARQEADAAPRPPATRPDTQPAAE